MSKNPVSYHIVVLSHSLNDVIGIDMLSSTICFQDLVVCSHALDLALEA